MRTLDLAVLGTVALAGCQRPAPPEPAASAESPNRREVTFASHGDQGVPREVLQVVAELQRVSFGTNSAGLGPQAKDALSRAARILRDHPRLRLELQGHAAAGEQAGDRPLGADRSHAVRDYLESRGLGRDRVAVVSFSGAPSATGRSKRVWSQNRRMEFRILWDQELAVEDALDDELPEI